MSEKLIIGDENQRIAQEFASQFGIDGTINNDDFIYWFEHANAPNDNKGQASIAYMQGGRATAHIVRDIVNYYGGLKKDATLLDFAAGYGRVSRFFKEPMPDVHVSASDIHQEAIDFLRSINVDAFQSALVPEDFKAPHKFDIIFALSFFTHMPKRTWTRWLQALSRTLEPNGLLIFTTHGSVSWPLIGRPQLDDEGFWFEARSEQKDLDAEEYGNTITTADYVSKHVRMLGLHLEGYRSAGIGHQDVYVIKALDPSVLPPPLAPTPVEKQRLDLIQQMKKIFTS